MSVEQLISTIERITAERNALAAKLAKAREERDELHNERHLFVIDKERQRLDAELARTRAQITEVTKQRDEYRTKGATHIRMLAVNNDELRARIAADAAELAKAREEIAKMKREWREIKPLEIEWTPFAAKPEETR